MIAQKQYKSQKTKLGIAKFKPRKCEEENILQFDSKIWKFGKKKRNWKEKTRECKT